MNYIEYKSPFGTMTLVSENNYLVGVYFNNQKYFLECINKSNLKNKEDEVLKKTKYYLNLYFDNKIPNFKDIPIKLYGTPFRLLVWNELLKIPYGETLTYKSIALKIKKKLKKENMSCEAIGGAVSHNPISIIVPCHRVIGTNGSLTGYAGGLDKKEKLLELERKNTLTNIK